MKNIEKIEHADKARGLIAGLAKIQDQVYQDLIKVIDHEDNTDSPLWDYVYNGGEFTRNLFVNTLGE